MTHLATLIARPQMIFPSPRSQHVVLLRFERGPEHASSLDTGHRRPWYVRRVTQQTLASQIRALAAERGYDKASPDEQRALRREIADELETRIQNVAKALVQTGQRGLGRPRVHHERCPWCDQALVSDSAKRAARASAKRTKK